VTRLLDLLPELAWIGRRLPSIRPSWRGLALAAALTGLFAISAVGLGGTSRPASATDAVPASGSLATQSAAPADLGLSAAASTLGGAADGGFGSPFDIAGKVVLVVVLLILTLRLLNRFSGGTNSRTARMTVLESRPLAQRATVYLIAVGERRLVVGLTPTGLVSLAELSADELPEAADIVDANAPQDAGDPAGLHSFERFIRGAADLARGRAPIR